RPCGLPRLAPCGRRSAHDLSIDNVGKLTVPNEHPNLNVTGSARAELRPLPRCEHRLRLAQPVESELSRLQPSAVVKQADLVADSASDHPRNLADDLAELT